MSGLHALRELLRSKQERLDVVSRKLSLEKGGIKEKLKFKNRILKKGKEKRLENLKLEIEGVEQRFQREKEQIENKIKAYEDKLEALEKTHVSRVQNYYNPMMNSLYESEEEVSEEDISLPLVYHKLKAEKDELTTSVTLLSKTIKDAEEKELVDMRAAYAAKIAKPDQVAKPKKLIRLAKKAPEPTIEEMKNELSKEWWAKLTRMRRAVDPLLDQNDPFWDQAENFLDRPQLEAWKAEGGVYTAIRSRRQHIIEQEEQTKAAEEAEKRLQEEEYRSREIERAKMRTIT